MKSQDKPKRQKRKPAKSFVEFDEQLRDERPERPTPELPPIERWDPHLFRSIFGRWPSRDE